MNISRRHWLAGVITPIASAQPSSWKHQQLETSIVKAVLSHTVKAVNVMADSPPWDRRPFAAAHAMAELAFLHFEETGFHTMLEQHLAPQFVPHVQVQPTELAEVVRDWGMHVPKDYFPKMLTSDPTGTSRIQPIEWSCLQTLLLRGFQVGMTTLTAPVKMHVRATWEPPWPLIVREPLLLKDPQLAAELPQLQAAGKVAIKLGVALADSLEARP